MAYEFHYTPTGTGVISGKEVLEQTEDAINDLGNTAISGVQEALDKAEQALTNSENAVDDAQTALNTANNAEGVAIQAQTDVGNLSGTVTNIGNRVTTAEGNITNLQGRMTTAEGNITNLQGRMTTAESDIGNLQTAVSTAQATANSAQQTATTARQQSYVFRYSSTALTPSSTNANSLLDNTDNLKVGDKVIDSSGVLFSITAIDTQNSTFTIGTALIDLAQDRDVVHKSGNEDVIGSKRFGVAQSFTGYPSIRLYSTIDDITVLPPYTQQLDIRFTDKNNAVIAYFIFQHRSDANEPFRTCWRQSKLDGTNNYYSVNFNNLGEFYPENNNAIKLGTSLKHWSEVYAQSYYYGLNNIEFSDKFVTTDTNQTISGNKTFSDNVKVRNNDITRGSTTGSGYKAVTYTDSNDDELSKISVYKISNGSTALEFKVSSTDNADTVISSSFQFFIAKNGSKVINPTITEDIALGRSGNKWSDVATAKVNGVEPSSLSLPDFSKRIDISSYVTNLNGSYNAYTPSVDGWIAIRSSDATFIRIADTGSGGLGNTVTSQTAGTLTCMIPVMANRQNNIYIACTTLTSAYFIPCQGNI